MLKKVTLVVLSIILLSLSFPMPHAMGETQPDTTLSVEPKSTFGLSIGQSFAIDIVVTNVTDLHGWQFYLYYQNAILNGTSIIEGPFLSGEFFYVVNFTDDYNATYGYMYVEGTLVGENVPGVNGTGTLATIIFKAVGSGYSLLHLDNTILIDSTRPFGKDILHTPIDGEVYVGSVNVAISGIDAVPNIALGSMALINVTAQNRGGFPETFDVTLAYNGTPIETKTVVNLPGAESRVLDFIWDTTPVSVGEYNLAATATVVPGETDVSDNTFSLMVYVGTVDLAITNLTSLKTIVGQNYSTPINVTVVNLGQVTGTSNITVYANATVIATFENITLTSGNDITLTFTWKTPEPLTKDNYTLSNYTMSAYVQPLPFEANTENNNFTSPIMVMVGMPGDVQSPFGKLDMKDIAYVAKRFGSTPSALLWDPNADIDGTMKVDMKDIAIVAKNFGKPYAL